jgi:hypothetical protein
MAQQSKKAFIIIISLIFIAWFFIAARPVPRETILAPEWINSFEAQGGDGVQPVFLRVQTEVRSSGTAAVQNNSNTGQIIPFTLGSRFGYVNSSGQFIINRIMNNNIYLGGNMWTEYPPEPSRIEIKSISDETLINIEGIRGYPVILDDRIFILGSEQNSLSEIDASGNIMWTYEYGAPLTCIDVAAGLVLTGSLDGAIEILNYNGNRIYYFEPGGSRYDIIYGCSISRNGTRFGIISGIDPQRFLLFERIGTAEGEYRIIYHEFLDGGLRRPMHISFIDEDRRIVYESERGIGCYNIRARRGINIPLEGNIAAIDYSGDQGLLFLITSHSMNRKELVGIKIPQGSGVLSLDPENTKNTIIIRASFSSENVFLGRAGSMLIAGGGKSLISFVLEDK